MEIEDKSKTKRKRSSAPFVLPAIDKNIEIPPKRPSVKDQLEKLVAKMEIGDSVLLERRHRDHVVDAIKARGFKAVSRADAEEMKLRVWLVENSPNEKKE